MALFFSCVAFKSTQEWKEEVVYFVLPDRFENGDRKNDGGAGATAAPAGREHALKKKWLPPKREPAKRLAPYVSFATYLVTFLAWAPR